MLYLCESIEHVDVVTVCVPLLHSAPLTRKNPDTRRKIVHHNYHAPTAYLGPKSTSGPSPTYLSFNLQREDTRVTAWLTDKPDEPSFLGPATPATTLTWEVPPAEAGSNFPCKSRAGWHNFSDSKWAKYIN